MTNALLAVLVLAVSAVPAYAGAFSCAARCTASLISSKTSASYAERTRACPVPETFNLPAATSGNGALAILRQQYPNAGSFGSLCARCLEEDATFVAIARQHADARFVLRSAAFESCDVVTDGGTGGGGEPESRYRWYDYELSTVSCTCQRAKGSRTRQYYSSDPTSRCHGAIPAGAKAQPGSPGLFFVDDPEPTPFREDRNWDLAPHAIGRMCLDSRAVRMDRRGALVPPSMPWLFPYRDCNRLCETGFLQERYDMELGFIGGLQSVPLYHGYGANRIQVGFQYSVNGNMKAICEIPRVRFEVAGRDDDLFLRDSRAACRWQDLGKAQIRQTPAKLIPNDGQ